MTELLSRLRRMASQLTLRHGVLFVVLVGAGGVTAASLLGRLGAWFLLFDLLSHYRLQYAGLLLIAVLVAAAARSIPVAAIAGVLFVLHLVPLAPLVNQPDQPEGPGTSLRVVQFNVLTNNTEVEAAAAWLVAQEPDVVVAQETDRRWTDGLASGMDGWTLLPTDTARADNFGMAVLVRDGLDVAAVEVFDRQSLPAIAVTITTDEAPVMLYAVHTLPPVSVDNVEVANEQLDVAADVLAAHDGPRLLVGDLNTTRWGATYRRIQPALNLRNAADGFGLTGSWPSTLWFTGMIGIDHILVSGDIRVEDWIVGPDLGSDHRPVLADLTIVG